MRDRAGGRGRLGGRQLRLERRGRTRLSAGDRGPWRQSSRRASRHLERRRSEGAHPNRPSRSSARSTSSSTTPASNRDRTIQRMSTEEWDEVIPDRPLVDLLHDERRHRRHARTQLRPHHQHVVDHRPDGQPRTGELRRREGRHGGLHEDCCEGVRALRHHRERHLSWLHRDRNGVGAVRRDQRDAARPESRRAASAQPRRWRPRCASSAPTAPSTPGAQLSLNGGQYM